MKIKLNFIFCFLSLSLLQAEKISKSKLYNINNNKYFSALEYAEAQEVRTLFYKNKEKLEFRFQNHKLTISPHSSFIQINSTIYHMALPIIFDGNDFFIPAKSFFDIANELGLPRALMDSSENFVIIKPMQYNIQGASIINKINGTEIIIKTNKKFVDSEIAASITNAGWLNITIVNAQIDSLQIMDTKLKNPIVRIRNIQSSESAQISFLLKSKIDDFNIETHKNNISIFLRTSINKNATKIREIRNNWILDTVVIDAGHGGKDPGAIGVGGLQEKTVNLDIARRLGKLIEKNLDIKVIYTRTEDVFIPLWKRTKIANDSGGKLFISIHANSAHKHVRGFETFLLRPGKSEDAIEVAQRENAVIQMEEQRHKYEELTNDKLILYTMAQSSFMKESEYLAAEVQKELDKVLTSPNRGVKQAGFHVLVGASMPNILIESGFLSNKTEAQLLGKSKYRQKIAQAIFSALVNFKDKYENPIINE